MCIAGDPESDMGCAKCKVLGLAGGRAKACAIIVGAQERTTLQQLEPAHGFHAFLHLSFERADDIGVARPFPDIG